MIFLRRKGNWRCTVWLTVFVIGASPWVAQCFLLPAPSSSTNSGTKLLAGALKWVGNPSCLLPSKNKQKLRRKIKTWQISLTSQRQMGKETQDCLLFLFPFKTKVTSLNRLLCFPLSSLMCLNYSTLYSSQHPRSLYYLIKSISSAAQKWCVLRPEKLSMKWASPKYWW